ncbi:MAG: phage holin family protein, partial [Actinomycetota bacterium]
ITLSDDPVAVAIVAIVFGLINSLIRPIVKLLTFPITIVTLGLFTLIINAAMLQLTDWLTSGLDVVGFWTSVFGGIVISLVSWFLSVLLPDEDDERGRQREHSH